MTKENNLQWSPSTMDYRSVLFIALYNVGVTYICTAVTNYYGPVTSHVNHMKLLIERHSSSNALVTLQLAFSSFCCLFKK